MAIFRWVGSGNTGSTSANIFNWNNASNWRIKTQITPNTFVWSGTTLCPGSVDRVFFGYSDGLLPGNTAYIEKVKSPCLFGGFIGNAAGGTWTNSANPTGTTLNSSLYEIVFSNQGNVDAADDNFIHLYSETEYNFDEMPFGGGLTASISCIENLQWIKKYYPNMGVDVSFTGGSFTATIPTGYNSTWDKLTLKSLVNNYYNWGYSNKVGTINVNYVPSYSTFGASGEIAAFNTLTVSSQKDVYISGGAFHSIATYKHLDGPSGLQAPGNNQYPRYPSFIFDNLTVETFDLNGWGKNLLTSTVRFADLIINNEETAKNWTPLGLQNNGKGYTVKSPPITHVLGSGSITSVLSSIYPGNTSNINNRKSTIVFKRDHAPMYDTSKAGATYADRSVKHWNELSLAHEQLYWANQQEFSVPYFTTIQGLLGQFVTPLLNPGVSDPISGSALNPYTTQLLLGEIQGTTSVDVGQIIMKNRVDKSDYHVCVLKMEGLVNVNEVYLGNYTMMECVDRGAPSSGSKINIGELRLAPLSTLNLRGSRDFYNFGSRGGTGVSGGIMAAQPGDYIDEGNHLSNPVGKIVYPQNGSIRLFNVNTAKAGSIQISPSLAVSEVAQIANTNKKG